MVRAVVFRTWINNSRGKKMEGIHAERERERERERALSVHQAICAFIYTT
jgi:hypothetical protein